MTESINILKQNNPLPAPSPSHKNRGLIFVVFAIVILLILWITWKYVKPKAGYAPVVKAEVPQGYASKESSPGQFPSEMPKDVLAIFPTPSSIAGQVITQPNVPTQVVARFIVKDSPEQVASLIHAYYLFALHWSESTNKVDGLAKGETYERFIKPHQFLEAYIIPNAASSTLVQLTYSSSN